MVIQRKARSHCKIKNTPIGACAMLLGAKLSTISEIFHSIVWKKAKMFNLCQIKSVLHAYWSNVKNAKFVMGYPCVSPHILFYMHGPAFLLCFFELGVFFYFAVWRLHSYAI